MSGVRQSKKPTYRDLQNEIGQLAGFCQKISSVLLQLDAEVVGLRNELEEKKVIERKVVEAEGQANSAQSNPQTDETTPGQGEVPSAEPTQARVEDYFKGESNE